MTHSPSTTSLGLEFNAFLFASVDNAADAPPLSVVSALARLDIDPWREAAELARMPRDAAAQRLAMLLPRSPIPLAPSSDREETARRLIALLPAHAGPPNITPRFFHDRAAAPSAINVLVSYVITILLLLTILNIMAVKQTVGAAEDVKPSVNALPAAVTSNF